MAQQTFNVYTVYLYIALLGDNNNSNKKSVFYITVSNTHQYKISLVG